jgi:hypothetical protein
MKDLGNIVQEVEEGTANALLVLAELKSYAKKLSEVINQVEEAAFIEADKYGAKTFTLEGYEYSLRDGRAMYNYKDIGDWRAADADLKLVEYRHKQAYLASLNGDTAISQDGEVIELPKVSYAKPSLAIKKIQD